jgi:hypothetical protein
MEVLNKSVLYMYRYFGTVLLATPKIKLAKKEKINVRARHWRWGTACTILFLAIAILRCRGLLIVGSGFMVDDIDLGTLR